MNYLIYSDAIRYAHLISVAFGLGTALLTEILVFSHMRKEVSANFLKTLKFHHRMILCGLAAMWITGSVLVYLKTGFSPENFTPKIIGKMFVVSLLTFNALLIDRVVIPVVESSIGKRLLSLPGSRLAPMAFVAGVSTTSWLLALGMGVSKTLADASTTTILALICAAYGFALIFAACVIFMLDLHSARTSSKSQPAQRAGAMPKISRVPMQV